MTVALENLMTVKQLAAAYPAFTEPMIRWWIFNADTNGFNVCIIRIGGRVLIDRAAFEHWLEAHRAASFTPESA
ncbi:DNA-binding protein [Ciceribacter azotifigens]|uniref:DNA-binding protein n=1 Tax=Ciceribacter azotifigens TaxID=2069303 RepID=UPI003A8611E3